MKAFQWRGIWFSLTAVAALLAHPAHAQLDDLFRSPGNTHQAAPSAAAQEPQTPVQSRPARQATGSAPQAASSPAAPPETKAANANTVVIYTTPTCPHCRRALKHMQDRRIAYVQKDIQHDRANHAEFKRIGGRGVPHILMGSHVMVGFSPQGFDRRYAAWRAEAAASR